MTSLTTNPNVNINMDEAALVERAKSEPAAFGALYNRYVERIYDYALRETRDVAVAQDITATTFESALRHIRRFRWEKMGLAPWLYRIARNEIIQNYRRDKRLGPLTIDDGIDSSEQGVDVRVGDRPIESSVLSDERDQSLHEALMQLSRTDREVVTLRFLEQLSTEEVAQILDCSRNVVYVRLHRALERLRGHLIEIEGKQR